MSNNSTSVNSTTSHNLVQDSPCASQDDDSRVPAWVKIFLYSVIIVASLLGNTLVISIIRSHHKLKAATNYFILNLAASGILITGCGAGYALIAMVLGVLLPNNLFGTLVCKIIHPTAGISLCGAILTLVVIAFDRFLAIKLPLRKIVTLSVARYLIALIWFASFLACSPLIYAIKLQEFEGMGYCTEKWTPWFSDNSAMIYTICYNVTFYVIPLSLMTVLYGVIIHKVWARHIPGQVTDANQRLENKIKRSVLKMLMTVVLVFAACWLPINIAMVLTDFGSIECVSTDVMFAGWILGYSNAAINPLIYLIYSRDYRQGAMIILRKLAGCCRKPSLMKRMQATEYSMDTIGQSQTTTAEMESEVNNAAVITSFKRTQEQ